MNKICSLIAVLLLFCANNLFAQSVPVWGGGADQRDFSAGFSFSYVNSYYKIDKNPNWQDAYYDKEGLLVTEKTKSISSDNAPGFAVGFLGRYRLSDHLEARLTPSLVFADRKLSYRYENSSMDRDKSIRATLVDLPLSLKLKSDRISNYRAYILAGAKYSQALGNKANADENAVPIEKLVKNINGYASYEVGLGFDIYFEFFKMSPEIKLSNSFGNVMLHENNAFSTPINKLSLHTLMFSLYF